MSQDPADNAAPVRIIRGQVFYLPEGADGSLDANWIPYGQVPDLGPVEVTKSIDDGRGPSETSR
ncbi:hypothetical protein [Nocardia bovistercoris]|uniref:Uncharacterized protein n=1 Tax=Nocardia bovistercoris TaxID=2785916 RepID=A0A931I7Z4_9NOCA|nr:hypothetical protein [Nocardia bovistercoris]MBH0775961.1 hypothetical protein [Nocardia bovistercoris]